MPPTPLPPKSDDDWSPFKSQTGFEVAELLYTKAHLSHKILDDLLSIWSATLIPHDDSPPIADHHDLHAQIDKIQLRHIPWQSYTVEYQGIRPDNGPAPEWMDTKYQLWYRDPRKLIHDLVANTEFASGMDYTLRCDFKNGKQQYGDFMSGDWAWDQCVS